MFFTGELIRLQRLFQESNIRAIALKGPALAASVYGNIGFRGFSDLDFLVRRDQVITAAHVLMNEKFISEFEPTAATQESFLNTQCEMVLRRDDSILVEIHWAFAPRYFGINLCLEPIWERYDELPLDGLGFPTLLPADLFLALSIHGSKHCWNRLIWICDIAQILRTYHDLNWDDILSKGRKLGILRIIYLASALARDLLGVPPSAREIQTGSSN